MAKTTFQGTPVTTNGELPAIGSIALNFELVGTDLNHVSLSDFKGKRVILNIFPSLDTPTCSASVRRFNKEAADLTNTVILAISKDLPFAHSRFCTVEGIDNVTPASGFRTTDFDDKYGVLLVDSPLKGLYARAVVLIDEEGKVAYTELISEIANEPDYDALLALLK